MAVLGIKKMCTYNCRGSTYLISLQEKGALFLLFTDFCLCKANVDQFDIHLLLKNEKRTFFLSRLFLLDDVCVPEALPEAPEATGAAQRRLSRPTIKNAQSTHFISIRW